MSDQKKLNKRLKDLFADLEDGISHLPIPIDDENPLGWTWECDTHGQYIACGPEVEEILGVSANDFLGQPLSTFRLALDSQKHLAAILKKKPYLKEIVLEFIDQDKSNVSVRMQFLNSDNEDGTEIRWHGFTQVIQEEQLSKSPKPPLPIQGISTDNFGSTSFSGLEFSNGVAIENDKFLSVSTPFSAIGAQSLALRQTVVQEPGSNLPAALAVPVELQQQAIGLLEFIDENPNRRWSEEEQRLVEEVAGQLSLALENARLIQQITDRSEELALINRVVSQVAASLDLSESLQVITTELGQAINVQTGFALLDKLGNTLKVVSDYNPDPRFPSSIDMEISVHGNPSSERAIATKKPVIIDDAQSDPSTETIYDSMQELGIYGLAIFPLVIQDEVIGTLGLGIQEKGRSFTQNDIQLAETIISQASSAIQNARLFEQIQARSIQLQTAAEISRAASSILEPNPLILQAVNLIRDRFNLYYAGIFLTDQDGSLTGEEGRWAVLRAGTGEAGRIQVEQAHKLEIGGTSMIGQCVAKSEARISLQTADETQRFINPHLPDTQSEMALPLISRGRVIGAMTIQSVHRGAFTNEDISVLQTMADQVANALQNANLFDQTQARAEELAILNEMSRVLTDIREVDLIVESVFEFTSRLMDTTIFHIALYDEESDELLMPLVSINGERIQTAPRNLGNGLTDHIIRTKQHLLFNDNVIEEMEAIGIEVIPMGEGKDPLSWLGVPLIIGDKGIGAISVQSITTPRLYNEYHQDLLSAISSQVAISLQNANLFAQTQSRAEELNVLNEMSLVLSSQLEIDEIIQTIYKFTSQLMDTSYFFVCLYESEDEIISFPLVVENKIQGEILPMKKSRGLTQHVIDSKKPLLIYENVDQVITELDLDHIVVGEPAKSWLGVPFLIGDEVLGAIATQNANQPRMFNEHHQDLLLSVARQSAIALQNSKLFSQTQEALSETEALLNIASVSSRSLELQSSLKEVLKLVLDTTNFEAGLITILNPKSEQLELIVDQLPEPLLTSINENGFEGTLCELVYLRKEAVVIPDFLDKPPVNVSGLVELGFEGYQGVPLESRGQILGTLCTFKRSAIDTSDSTLSLMQAVGQQVGIAIENANLFEQSQRQLSNISTIQATTADLSAALTLDGVINTLLVHLTSAILADSASVFLLEGEKMARAGVGITVDNRGV